MHVFLNIWAAIGPLAGVALGFWLTTTNQHNQWWLDNKRDEYRELMTTLTECASQFTTAYSWATGVGPEEQRLAEAAARDSINVIFNRLFIAGEVEKLNLMKRWQDAVDVLRHDNNASEFEKGITYIMRDIRRVALKDFS